jgi:class 3 adenylate cyclase
MKSLGDYDEHTSPYELFEHLHNEIISRRITNLSSLLEYTRNLPKSKANQAVLRKAFRLIRELNWGKFSRLDPEEFPALWKELVLPSRELPGAGDLKRNTSISSVYTAILDIHGYSAFCFKHRRNLSMLELLDECIQRDIHRICSAHGTLGWLSEGDTLVLVAADGRSITRAVLNIVDYFSRRRIIKSDEIIKSRVVNKIVLPDMAVSAGIAGGRTFTPMVITYDGNISGDIVNSAARLQNFANILDPDKTRILATNHVTHQLSKRRSAAEQKGWETIDYFFLGRFGFKGMELTVFELLFNDGQKIKLRYQKQLVQLYKVLRKDLWRDRVFSELMNVLSRAISTAKASRIGGVAKEDLVTRCDLAAQMFASGTNYRQPIEILEELMAYLPEIPGADAVLILYTRHILKVYREIASLFYREIEGHFEQSLNKYLDLAQRDLYLKAAKSREVHEKIRDSGIKSVMGANQKYLWHRVIDEHPDLLGHQIYIGKN